MKRDELKKKLSSQQNNFKKHVRKAGTCAKVSCLITDKLTQKGKPLIDGELIKECIVNAFSEYCPEKVNSFNETSLSHQTIGKKIDDLADCIVGTLQTQLSKCVHYNLALDKSSNQSDTAQIVIRGIDIMEEMLDMCHMKGTTTGSDKSGEYLVQQRIFEEYCLKHDLKEADQFVEENLFGEEFHEVTICELCGNFTGYHVIHCQKGQLAVETMQTKTQKLSQVVIRLKQVYQLGCVQESFAAVGSVIGLTVLVGKLR
ncbi:Hypothetical predicted protein [Octopus vulgaris]|uniref:Uncharacterized protein n=1 Tax=Octopus vulgaris TaxID=6645 RepID=A0AA36BUL9_OCTVU|nr:Hypothetical predicted protein [Octopus vulgaris]